MVVIICFPLNIPGPAGFRRCEPMSINGWGPGIFVTRRTGESGKRSACCVSYSSVETTCALCEKERPLTFHHLIPKKCHTNKWFRRRYTRHEMGIRGIYVCGFCHQYIHNIYTEKELGRAFNTLEKLLADDQIQGYLKRVKPDKYDS